jgi:ribosomal protein S18 acetylase RimI-like enzyme
MPIRVDSASEADVIEIAYVAAQTFPLACPSALPPDSIATFIETNLSALRFREYLEAEDREVLVARHQQEKPNDSVDSRILGYAIVIHGEEGVPQPIAARPAVELSKIYVLPDGHGAGVAATLMAKAITIATTAGARCIWLGVNQKNQRAQRFYTKHGFAIVGTRTFQIGEAVENDFIMVRSTP